jgi:hypothetical protein
MTALTPDLYRPMYGDKVVQFFDKLLDDGNAGKPLMRAYLESYFDLYWDLDLGVQQTRSLNGPRHRTSVQHDPRLSRSHPEDPLRELHDGAIEPCLPQGVDRRPAHHLESGKTPNPEKAFAWYWLKNAGDGEYFAHKDVVFEVFHNFVALSQWGNSVSNEEQTNEGN